MTLPIRVLRNDHYVLARLTEDLEEGKEAGCNDLDVVIITYMIGASHTHPLSHFLINLLSNLKIIFPLFICLLPSSSK